MSKSRDLADLPAGSGDINVDGTVTADGLTVDGDIVSQTNVGAILSVRNASASVSNGTVIGEVRFESDDTSRTQAIRNSIVSVGLGSAASTDMHFRSAESDNLLDRMTISYLGDISFYEDTGTTPKLFWDASEESLGIGTTSPASPLHVSTSIAGTQARFTSSTTSSRIQFETSASDDMISVGAENEQLVLRTDHAEIIFRTNENTEAMRIDSSGNLLVGQTISGLGTQGATIYSSGVGKFNVTDGRPLYLRREGTDGDLIQFVKNTTTMGSIGVSNSGTALYISAPNENRGIKIVSDDVRPTIGDGTDSDNSMDLGNSTARWDDVYATNGTIQTSDRNEKQDIEELSEAEQRVAVACKGLLRKFRWKDAVAEKGDDARIHFGIIAQDLQAAFEAEGLDAGRYAMFISSTWWESEETYTDDDGVEQTRTNTYDTADEAPEGATERTRLGVRYPELLAFIIAAI